jgi:hypothetical protein
MWYETWDDNICRNDQGQEREEGHTKGYNLHALSVTVPSVFYILKANNHRKNKRGVVVCLAVLSELR